MLKLDIPSWLGHADGTLRELSVALERTMPDLSAQC